MTTDLRTIPFAYEIAKFASAAGFVDGGLLRRLRKTFFPDADANAESCIWWSDIVEFRGSNGLTFTAEALDELRLALAEEPKLGEVLESIRKYHEGGPPLLLLEEKLIALELTREDNAAIEDCLEIALRELDGERSDEVLSWAERSLSRFPRRVRGSASAWALSLAVHDRFRVPLAVGESVSNTADAGRLAHWLDKLGDTHLEVALDGNEVVATEVDTPTQISLPATNPLVLFLEGDSPRTVTVERGATARIGAVEGQLVLRSLRGDRWGIRVSREQQGTGAPIRRAPRLLDEPRPDSGAWVLVDGTARFELPPDELELARELGTTLAHAGHSLITLGTPGVAHVVARSFMKVLEGQGYTSGIYRLVHVMPDGRRADYWERGRTMPPRTGDPIDEALRRADLVVSIGTTPITARWSQVWELSTMTEPPPDRIALALSVLAPRFSDERTILDPLFMLAARAMDERDLDDYNRLLDSYSTVENPNAHLSLLLDRRPSRRLAFYMLSGERHASVDLAGTLECERETIDEFWETRTLWFALQELLRSRPPIADPESLAAAFVLVADRIHADHRIDIGGEIKELLGRVEQTFRRRVLARAHALLSLSQQWESDRTLPMPPVSYEGSAKEAEIWANSGHGGAMVAAMLIANSQDVDGYRTATHALAIAEGPREVEFALVALDALADRLTPKQCLSLHAELALPGLEDHDDLVDRIETKLSRLLGSRRTWMHVHATSFAAPEFDKTAVDEVSEGDRVLVFGTMPRPHPLGVYLVGPERGFVPGGLGMTTKLRLLLALPPLGAARLDELTTPLAYITSSLMTARFQWAPIADASVTAVLEQLYREDEELLGAIHLLFDLERTHLIAQQPTADAPSADDPDLVTTGHRHRPRVWLHTRASTPVTPDETEVVGAVDIQQRDLVVILASGRIRPIGIYEVKNGRRNINTRSGRVSSVTARCNLVLALPDPGDDLLSANKQTLSSLANSTSQRDTRNLGLHERLLALMSRLYDDSVIIKRVEALLDPRDPELGEGSSETLATVAEHYTNARASLVGGERTVRMAAVFSDAVTVSRRTPLSDTEIRAAVDAKLSGSHIGPEVGRRIVAIASMQAHPAAWQIPILLQMVEYRASRFEQYQALRALKLALERATEEQRAGAARKLQEIERVRTLDDEGHDKSRIKMLREIVSNSNVSESEEREA